MNIGDIYKRGHTLVTVVGIGDKVEYLMYGKKRKRLRHTFERDFTPVDMGLATARTIEVTEMEHCEVHSDAGRNGMCFVCPVCGVEVVDAPYGWWSMNCHCRRWTVEHRAIGTLLHTDNSTIYVKGGKNE